MPGRTHPLLYAVTILVTAFFFTESCAAERSGLPLPSNVSPEIIAEEMLFNGSPMEIIQFKVLDTKPVEAFYRRYFSEYADKRKFSENSLHGHKYIGAMIRKKLVNVEFMPAEGKLTTVLVSSIEPEKAKKPEELAKDIPRLGSTEILQHMSSRDGPKENRIVIMSNPHSVEANAGYLREHYQKKGWSRVRDNTIKTTVARQLMFAKKDRTLVIDIQRLDRDSTKIVFNEIKE